MRKKTYPKASRAALLDELVARLGIDPRLLDVATGDDQTIVSFPDDIDPAIVDQVVGAHDAAAYDARDAADKQQFLADVAGLKQYQGLASPTLAQTAAAVKAQSRILKRVVQELRDL